jgi:CHAT domain-containing protein
VGNLEDSEKALKESLAVAEQYGEMSSSQDISATLLSLGNTARAKPDVSAALDYYQRAAAASPSLTTKVQAQLNQLSLLVDKDRFPEARALALEIQPAITQLPPNRAAVDARINLAKSLMKLGSSEQAGTDANSTPAAIAQQLSTAAQQAKVIKDLRAESYALGELGTLYEQNKQLSEAQTITEEALLRAQSINAPDIAYRWQWQLGRLLNAQGKTESAITAYDSAVKTLESLRSDLATINPDVQFSFRDSIEPVYRELVGLLLQNKGGETDQKNLRQARELIESLQQAELINFFREDCLNATAVQIDQIDPEAAVIYPIILKDRVAVVLSRPNAELRLYTSPATSEQIDETLKQLLDGITIPRLQLSRKNFLAPSKQLYDWLIKPAEEDLAASQAKTLVFVLDGPLLNLPMAVLNDGEQFLIEKYAIAYTPGLQLLNSNPLERGELTALKAGISEAVQGFEPLPFVEEEFEKIKSTISGELLLNETFTSEAIQQQIDSVSSPVVHLATHGQFSSKAEDTFILTWDKKLDVNQLNTLLRSREESGRGAIELLVLSACETAAGDKRAALGLAGVAVRAGARSTLATLWYVSDAATADIMTLFYGSLSDTTVTKAEALRRAQVELLKDSRYQQPIYWAPYVLVGNWR